MDAEWLDLSEVRNTDISFLRTNRSLRILYVGSAYTLAGVSELTQVRELRLLHIPKVTSLEPVSRLQGLQILVVATPPSWDASRRCIEVESLAPLGRLKNLGRLDLCGVLPRDRTLKPLGELVNLRQLLISHVYAFGMEDYADLARHLPRTVGACLRPCYSMGFETPCRKCRGQTVFLTGPRPRTRRQLCPTCDRAKLEEHIAEWNRITGRVFAYPAKAKDVAIERPVPLEELQDAVLPRTRMKRGTARRKRRVRGTQ